jgi:hypothetical protein
MTVHADYTHQLLSEYEVLILVGADVASSAGHTFQAKMPRMVKGDGIEFCLDPADFGHSCMTLVTLFGILDVMAHATGFSLRNEVV